MGKKYRVTYQNGNTYHLVFSSNISWSERVLEMLEKRSICFNKDGTPVCISKQEDFSHKNELASILFIKGDAPNYRHLFVNNGEGNIALDMLVQKLDEFNCSKSFPITELSPVDSLSDEDIPNDEAPLPNILNIKGAQKQQVEILKNMTVYRVMTVEHFLEWCESGQNTLVPVEWWNDPWERALFKNHMFLGNNQYVYIDDFSFYGQCWSYEKDESDATWRIFEACKNDCVRIGVSAWDLYECLSKQVDKENEGYSLHSCFAGNVEYLVDEQINQRLSEMRFGDCLNNYDSSLVKTLFIKKTAFEHEKEFRIIYHYVSGESYVDDSVGSDASPYCGERMSVLEPQGDLVKYDFPVSKIRSVKIGPRISHCPCELEKIKIECDKLMTQFKRNGVCCNIQRSEIYDYPNLNVGF